VDFANGFQYLLPPRDASTEELQVFQAFCQQPVAVPDVDVKRFLSLQPSNNSSPPTPTEQHHFNVRSWVFTVEELTRLIQHMTEEDNTFEEIAEWADVVKEQERSPTGAKLLTIRYIGTCEGPKRPIDRFNEDLTSRKSGILHEFVRVVELLMPHIHTSAKVHLIYQASLSVIAAYNADDVERVLIEYFGHRTLLNRQRGGYYTSYHPPAQDTAVFESLKTRFYERYTQSAKSPPEELRAHFANVQAFVNGNPATTGAALHPFTNSVRNTCISQAVPSYYNSNTVIIFLGKDITLEDYASRCTFIGGKSRAGLLTRDFSRRLAETEEKNHGVDWDNSSFDTSFFTFIDLWSWLWHKDEDEALVSASSPKDTRILTSSRSSLNGT
jgi:hypothetical protein